jgi:uncharacterized protein YhaN
VRIVELELVAYGRYENRVLPLTTEPRLQVVVGRNGDGKTTTLRASSDLLFGFPDRSTMAFRFASNLLKLRAKISYGDGGTLEFLRRKGRKNTLSSLDGSPLPDDALAEALCGIDQAVYETMFALDYDRLRAGAQALLESSGELGEALFGASFGSGGLHKLIAELEQEADDIFRPQASKPLLNRAIAEFEDARRQVRALALRASVRRASERNLDGVQRLLENTGVELLTARAQHNEMCRLQQVLPFVAQRASKLVTIEELGDVPSLPDDARERRLLALRTRSEADAALSAAAEKTEEVEAKLNGLKLSPALLDRSEEVSELHGRSGQYVGYGVDLPRVTAERDGARNEAQSALASVARCRTLDDVEDLRPSATLRVRLKAAENNLTVETERERAAAEALKNVRQELLEEEVAAPAASKPSPLERAQAVLRGALKRGDLDDLTRRARDTAADARREAATVLASLPFWQGDFKALAAFSVPTDATIGRFASQFEAADTEIRETNSQVANVEKRQREIDTELNGPDSAFLPTEEEIAHARDHRTEGLRLVRGAWLGDDDENVSADFAAGAPLDIAFERSIEHADDLVDRSRQHAQAVAYREGLISERARLDAHYDALEQAAASHGTALALLRDEWAACWPGLEGPLAPAEMRGWLERRARVIELDRTASLSENEARRACELLDQELSALRDAVSSISSIALDGSETFATAVAALETAVATVVAERTRASESETCVRELNVRRTAMEEAHATAKAERVGAESAWADVVTEIGADRASTPAEVDETLTALDRLFDRLEDAAGLTRRIEGMNRGREEFEHAVAALVASVAPELAALPPEQAVSVLVQHVRAAESASVKEQQLQERLDDQAEAASDAQEERQRAQLELDLLCESAGTSLDELEKVEQSSEQLRAIRHEVASLETTISEVGVGTLAHVVAVAEAADPGETAAQVQHLAATVSELEGRQTELIREATRLETELSQGAGGAGASAAAEEAEAAVAQAARLVDRFVVAKLASVALRRAIDVYREQHQGPVLARVRELFPLLTVGRFDGIGLVGRDDELVLVGLRGAEEVPVPGMSDGERDALYLALRIATLERHFQENEPMPVIVDDLLAGLDNAPARATLEALAELAQRTQVVLFTHHEHVVALAKEALGANLAVHDLGADASTIAVVQAA